MTKQLPENASYPPLDKSTRLLLADLRHLIEQTRERAAQQVNSELVMLYWHVGARIRREILNDQRADYGRQIIATLSLQLRVEYGRAFDRSALFRMVQFAEVFADEPIVATLSRQLGWSHFRELLPIEDEL